MRLSAPWVRIPPSPPIVAVSHCLNTFLSNACKFTYARNYGPFRLSFAVRFEPIPSLAVFRFHRPARDSRARLYLMAQGCSCCGYRCTGGGYPPLVWMGIRTSIMNNRRHHRNGSNRFHGATSRRQRRSDRYWRPSRSQRSPRVSTGRRS